MEIKQELWRASVLAVAAIALGVSMESANALAQPPEALLVERYQWHDADTAVGAIVRLPYGILLEGAIRAADYDAWEIGSRGGQSVDDAERARGRKAVEELRNLTDGGRLYIVPVPPGTRDSFGRLLGRFYVRRASGDVVDVRQWAVNGGHVRKGGK